MVDPARMSMKSWFPFWRATINMKLPNIKPSNWGESRRFRGCPYFRGRFFVCFDTPCVHQKFKVPKMEVLYLMFGCFGGGFPLTLYISLIA